MKNKILIQKKAPKFYNLNKEKRNLFTKLDLKYPEGYITL